MFKTQTCFDRHKQLTGSARSICAMMVKCPDCGRIIKRYKGKPGDHRCGMVKYNQCYKQPVEKRDGDMSDDGDSSDDVTEGEYDQCYFSISSVDKRMEIM